MSTTSKEQRRRIVEVLCIQAGEPSPFAERDRRRRQVAVLKIASGEPLSTPAPARRKRADPIDDAPIRAAWDKVRRDRARRYEALGMSLENGGSRARCRRCGEIVLDVLHGLVGVTPSALYVMHAQRTGCR